MKEEKREFLKENVAKIGDLVSGLMSINVVIQGLMPSRSWSDLTDKELENLDCVVQMLDTIFLQRDSIVNFAAQVQQVIDEYNKVR